MLNKQKSRKVAAIIAFTGTLSPIAGLHKFYLGQPVWGLLYLLLSWTPIPRVASAIDAIWYLFQNEEEFDHNFNSNLEGAMPQVLPPTAFRASYGRGIAPVPKQSQVIEQTNVNAIADALRQLDCLRQDGLISEYEFEQKRRQLLNRMS